MPIYNPTDITDYYTKEEINILLGLVPGSTEVDEDTTLTPNSDAAVFVDASGGPITIYLPAVADSEDKFFYIKKKDTTDNGITIQPETGEKIDGVDAIEINIPNESLKILCDSVAWWII